MMNPTCVSESGNKRRRVVVDVDVRSRVVVDGCANAVLSSWTPEAEAVEGSDDLLKEILSRIPVKPLLRFKCVSKRWFSLISDPYFCHRHTLRHPTTEASGIFLCGGGEFASLNGNDRPASPIKSLSLDLDLDHDADTNNNDGIEILQSCNGLLLCLTSSRYLLTPPPPIRKYFMYNPTTKHFSLLPTHPSHDDVSLELNLAFDPTRSPHYTLVCIRRINFDPSKRPAASDHHPPDSLRFYEITVYSSEAEPERRAWRPCTGSSSSFRAPKDMDFQRGVYYNGALHWFCSRTRVFLCFEVSQECLRNYNLPPLPRHFSHFIGAAACGHLHLVEECFTRKFRVLRLERDYSRCVLMYNVDLTQLALKFPGYFDSFYYRMLLSLVQHDSEEDPSLLLHIPGNLILLRLTDNTFSKIRDLGLHPSDTSSKCQTLTNWYHTHDYIESLACV